ncbi:hypothetical protein EMPS_04365 [Entomortierella parvispora]|uniref:Tropomyosin n=1 Tax=Entomortierella parvispora TaxID=205924 RepID=A0A9P3LVF0_9FUNG|nr:hypothetical protein EMPS_04365 [Entomortierella parvispora]
MDKFKEKLTNLRAEADAAQTRAEIAERDLAAAKAEVSAKDQEAISLNNRIALLEGQLEKAETGGSDSKSKVRELELKNEDLERKVKTLEKENEAYEIKWETINAENKKIKDELEETMRAMDEL